MHKKKKDYLLHSLLFQSVICLILFGCIYGLKISNSNIYETLKTDYYDNIDENVLVEEAGPINDESKQVNSSVNNDKILKSNKSEKVNVLETKTITENILSAEISGMGGKDYSVRDNKSIPENVSVNNYSLSQNMIKPLNGRITSGFGIRNHPITNKLRFHAGVDIAAEEGTPIYSSYDGTVIKSTYDAWNGYYLKIQHENDIMTVYCHCKELKVKKGDNVKAGQLIATVGNTGSSTGPHLHYELRIKNVSYDPEIAFKTAINGV